MDNDLSDMQKDALLSFREQKGKQYKAYLQSCWLKSSYPGMSSDHAAALQQIRNQFGPGWLLLNGDGCTSERKDEIKQDIMTFMDVLSGQVDIPEGHVFNMPDSNSYRWYLDDIVESARQVSGCIGKVGVEENDPDQFCAEFRFKHVDNSVHVFASSGNQYAYKSSNMLDYVERNTPFVYVKGRSPLDAAQKCAAIWNNALAHAQAQESHSKSPAMGM